MRMIIFEQSKKIMKQASLYFTLLSGFLIASCSGNLLDVDISKSTYRLPYINEDSILQTSPPDQLEKTLETLKKDYPEVINYQFYYCYRTGLPGDTLFEKNWQDFQNNDYLKRLEKKLKGMYPGLPKHHQMIETGMKRLHVHLPKAKLPENLFFLNSYFASSVYCTEKNLCIGMERYLGPNSDVIKELPGEPFYEWIKKAMDEKFLERDAICGWVQTHIVPTRENLNHIEAMIDWGKILYCTEAAFPDMQPEILLRYSAKDYEWALRNERDFWNYLVKQNLLFQKNATEQAGFIQEGPFTAGIPQKGPDRLGQFLGYRIVKSYIEQNDVTLEQLLKLSYSQILQDYEIND